MSKNKMIASLDLAVAKSMVPGSLGGNGFSCRFIPKNSNPIKSRREKCLMTRTSLSASKSALSKICAVVGEQNADGTLNIVGLGQSPARGMRKGEIVDARARRGMRPQRRRRGRADGRRGDPQRLSRRDGQGICAVSTIAACIRWFLPIAKFQTTMFKMRDQKCEGD